jgi:hypothetical protein
MYHGSDDHDFPELRICVDIVFQVGMNNVKTNDITVLAKEAGAKLLLQASDVSGKAPIHPQEH